MGQTSFTRTALAVSETLAATWLVEYLFEKAKEMFNEKPKRPPPPPPDDFNISQDDLIREAQETLGMDVINNYNYAVCGPRGTGKSTLINCIRQVDDDGKEAAPTGITETTNEIRFYKFPPSLPELQRVVLWDIPGSGTVKHSSESYFKKNTLYAFDCLLITSHSNHFGEEQIKIMNEAQKYNTPVVLLITKLEQAVDAEVKKEFKAQFKQDRNYHPSLNEYRPIVKETIEKLKSHAQSQPNIAQESRIFVISAQKLRDYLNSVEAEKQEYAEEDVLFSGEMLELIRHLIDETSRRRN